MRLIDADKLKQTLLKYRYTAEHNQIFRYIDEQPTKETDNLQKSIKYIIQEVSEDICDNYCKYRNTVDEDVFCDAIRDGSPCPLVRLQ